MYERDRWIKKKEIVGMKKKVFAISNSKPIKSIIEQFHKP